jgi:hypothetical protein
MRLGNLAHQSATRRRNSSSLRLPYPCPGTV